MTKRHPSEFSSANTVEASRVRLQYPCPGSDGRRSVEVEVGPGIRVTGATINTSGRLLVRATRVGSETTLAQMARLVSRAQTGKAPIARLADRISAVFVPVVLGIAVLTFVLWLLVSGPAITEGELRAAFTAAVAVLGPGDAHVAEPLCRA